MNQQVSTLGRTQSGSLSTNKMVRNTYMLLSMTLAFSALTAGVSMALNLPYPNIILILVGYFGLLFLTTKFRDSGLGIAFVPEDIVASRIRSGALELVLGDWSPPFDGYFLYYPSRRQNLPAFQIIVDALRHRGG